MRDLEKRIDELRGLLKKHGKADLKELPTRTIFIDPLLETLGWNIRDPDDVELERPTIDGKSVDYALKINGKPVAFVEAKPLGGTFEDVKAITQVVGYAANDGVSCAYSRMASGIGCTVPQRRPRRQTNCYLRYPSIQTLPAGYRSSKSAPIYDVCPGSLWRVACSTNWVRKCSLLQKSAKS